MNINNSTVSKIFYPVHTLLPDLVRESHANFTAEFEGDRNFAFSFFVMPDNTVRIYPTPLELEQASCPTVIVQFRNTFNVSNDDLNDISQTDLRFEIPTSILFQKCGNYCVYCVYFNVNEDDPAFSQIERGYFGITKRAPWSRFKEHKRKVETRRGSLLHRVWLSLVDGEITHVPVFRVVQTDIKTLDEAYSVEEELVGENTLTPLGLNAIPGGMAGIRMMHQLRVLNSTGQISIEKRDAAIEHLIQRTPRNSASPHYRSGHVRKLSSGKNTWVRACWVNLNQMDIAA